MWIFKVWRRTKDDGTMIIGSSGAWLLQIVQSFAFFSIRNLKTWSSKDLLKYTYFVFCTYSLHFEFFLHISNFFNSFITRKVRRFPMFCKTFEISSFWGIAKRLQVHVRSFQVIINIFELFYKFFYSLHKKLHSLKHSLNVFPIP